MPPPLPDSSRRVRVFCYSAWAEGLEPAADFLARLPGYDVRGKMSDPHDERLRRMARLDCDWYGENIRCFAAMTDGGIRFLPARVFGAKGITELLTAATRRPADEEWWAIFLGQQPQALGPAAGKVFSLLRRQRVRPLYYAFDEASRTMPCFNDIAPHLDVLIHDESPLAETGRARLRPDAVTIHRSWVANVMPWAVPFNPVPEEKILFLGSQLGLTPHRQRQIDFLRERFKDRFVAYHDHSVPVAERDLLNRFKVGLCPEGRKFTTSAMAHTHTDRPFWSGCLGLVPVSENSAAGGRLEELHRTGLIVRYTHGDLKSLAIACERALAMGNDERRRTYEHFNRRETVGVVAAEAIAAAAEVPLAATGTDGR